MPLRGGAADKFGNRYEGAWTVLSMIEIMREHGVALRVEPLGEEGEGVDFWLQRRETREYHQVKRQHGALGHWSLVQLAREGVLAHFWEKLRDSDASCRFVSTHAADQLDELAERARKAASWEEFDRHFLGGQKHRKAFNQLREYWPGVPDADVYDALKRVYVVTISENLLRTEIGSHLESLVEGDPSAVRSSLAQFALDKVHIELTAHDIWHHLQDQGFNRRQWSSDPHVLSKVDQANDRYLAQLRGEAIGGKVIPREETQAALNLLMQPEDKQSVLLFGEAGTGKSGIILQVLDELRNAGWPLLAFRVDRLGQVALPKLVGEQIELPESPAIVLASIAEGRDCVLVIDQLDAVSWASGRHPEFFECVYEIITQARAHPNMQLLLGCREFDLDNDHRLRKLVAQDGVAQGVKVGHLSADTVRRIVSDLGLDETRLQDDQLMLLSLPLHLKLLSQVTEDPKARALDFETANDLYDRFWDHKQDVLRQRLGRSVRWTDVVDVLSTYMSDHQVLSAPTSVVDELRDDARAMASENVLVEERVRYSFFHEGFFDYAFARRFTARGRELLMLFKSNEQHLFRRAQVRQILLHERESDPGHYLADLGALLTRGDIRFHIKQVVLGLLSNLADPTDEEWRVLASLIVSSPSPQSSILLRSGAWALEFCLKFIRHALPSASSLRVRLTNMLFRREYAQHAWSVVVGSPPWVQLLDRLGLVEKWLSHEDEGLIDQMILAVASVQREMADRVAELIQPYICRSDDWHNRLVYVMRRADLGVSRRFFELFLQLISKGVLDDAKASSAINSEFWNFLYGLSEESPAWACEAISRFLNRRLDLTLSAGEKNPFHHDQRIIQESQFAATVITRSSNGAPVEFVSEVLPFMLKVMELTADKDRDPPLPDPVWGARSYGFTLDTQSALLGAMEKALSVLERDEPDIFAEKVVQLRKSDHETAQYLLIRAYAEAAPGFADEAADYIADNTARLRVGYVEEPRWATRELLKAIAPHCSSARLRRIEKTILGYYPEWEKRRSFGYSQFVLLSGIPAALLSKKGLRRLQELQRKFGLAQPQPPEVTEIRRVTSPIHREATEKMTDDQWLQAIARYDYDRTDQFLTGGAIELSRRLESEVKKTPERFARLVLRFPDDTNSHYFDAVLRGFAESDLDLDAVLEVCERCHRLPTRPCGRSIAQAVARLADQDLPLRALDMVALYATEDPDPDKELWRTKSPSGAVYYGGDVLTSGLNSVRGGAAHALGKLILRDPNRTKSLVPALERLVQDTSVAVRANAALALLGVLNHDSGLAVALFLRLCDADDVLLSTRYIEQFLYFALTARYGRLKPIVERMISSNVADAAVAGARQASLAALTIREAHPLAQRCLQGTNAQRLGAAQVFSANLRTAAHRSYCQAALVRLFGDASEEIRSEAASSFSSLQGEELTSYIGLVESFIRSPSFNGNFNHLMNGLENTTAKLPEVALKACERFVDVAGVGAAIERTLASLETRRLSQTVLRLYKQQSEGVIQTRCLDLIDRMGLLGSRGLGRSLERFDR